MAFQCDGYAVNGPSRVTFYDNAIVMPSLGASAFIAKARYGHAANNHMAGGADHLAAVAR